MKKILLMMLMFAPLATFAQKQSSLRMISKQCKTNCSVKAKTMRRISLQ